MRASLAPCVWLDGRGKEAAGFYAAAFPDASLLEDSGLVQRMRLSDLELSFLNGGPQFSPNPSISLFYHCRSEDEIDRLWARLSEGGSVLMELGAYPFAPRYGWLADRYGVNWQLILPEGEFRQRAFPALMFTGANAGRAEEAIDFYASLFEGSGRGRTSRYGAGMEPDREGTLNYAEFRLGGSWFSAMDSAHPHGFSFTEGLSLIASCESQAEIDYFWSRLSEGGSEGRCGWLKDRYGLSWQVVPRELAALMSDPERAQRVLAALMPMGKLDLEALRRA